MPGLRFRLGILLAAIPFVQKMRVGPAPSFVVLLAAIPFAQNHICPGLDLFRRPYGFIPFVQKACRA